MCSKFKMYNCLWNCLFNKIDIQTFCLTFSLTGIYFWGIGHVAEQKIK